MIQRIQTVYLLLATVLLSISTVFGFGNFICRPGGSCACYGTAVYAALVFFAAVLSAVGIFLYRNRPLQAKVVRYSLLFILLAYICVAIAGYMQGLCSFIVPKFMIFFPFAAAFFNVLARRAILKDEKMVRAADRIR